MGRRSTPIIPRLRFQLPLVGVWVPWLVPLVLAALVVAPAVDAFGDPASATQARQVVRGWLRMRPQALGRHLGSAVNKLVTSNDHRPDHAAGRQGRRDVPQPVRCSGQRHGTPWSGKQGVEP